MSYDERDEQEYGYSENNDAQQSQQTSDDYSYGTSQNGYYEESFQNMGNTGNYDTGTSDYNSYDSNYGQDPRFQERPKSNGKGIAALILGIVSIVFFCIPIVSIITGIIGLVLGIICISRKEGKGLGIAGVITSAIGLIIAVIVIILYAMGISQGMQEVLDEYNYSEDVLDDTLEDDNYDYDDYEDDGEYYAGELGDTMYTYFFSYTVDSAQYVDSYAGYTAPEGYRLIDAVITVENTTDDEIPMWTQDFQIQWGEGDEDYGYGTLLEDESVMPEEYDMQGGDVVTYHVIYEVPEDSYSYSISYQEYFTDDTTGDVFFVYFDLSN